MKYRNTNRFTMVAKDPGSGFSAGFCSDGNPDPIRVDSFRPGWKLVLLVGVGLMATTVPAAPNQESDSVSSLRDSLPAARDPAPSASFTASESALDTTAAADSLDEDSCDAIGEARMDTPGTPKESGNPATESSAKSLSRDGEPTADPSKPVQSDLTFQAAVTRAAGHTFTIFRLGLPESTSVTLEIVDDHGAKRRTVFNGELSAGEHAFPYDGRGEKGRPLPTGMYYCRLESAGAVRSVPLNIAP